jgi:ribonuclease HI
MELMGAIKGLKHLLINKFESEPICVVSDSQYVIHGMTMWMDGWKRKGRLGPQGNIKNKEYWVEIDGLAKLFKSLRWTWVRGHRGNEGNEFCDQAARAAAFRLGGLVLASKEQLEY